MSSLVPRKYHELAPFQQFFKTGLPLLMYHKLGTRPAGAKLKGLYASTKRFVQQMDELKAAGFSTFQPGEIFTAALEPGKLICITFDDGARNVFEHGMEPLSRNGFRAMQYLIFNFIGKLNEWDIRDGEVPEPLMDEFQVRDWLAAGHRIGSHTLSHSRLARLTLRDAREEIFASKKRLEDAFGVPVEDFCYPYGNYNDQVRDLVQAAGYRTASTTHFGLNTPQTPPMALHRIPVRYPTRSLKALRARLFA